MTNSDDFQKEFLFYNELCKLADDLIDNEKMEASYVAGTFAAVIWYLCPLLGWDSKSASAEMAQIFKRLERQTNKRED